MWVGGPVVAGASKVRCRLFQETVLVYVVRSVWGCVCACVGGWGVDEVCVCVGWWGWWG